MYLGIDFGTTRTVVAAVDQGRYPLVVFETPEGLKDYLPGMAFSREGKLAFGWEAGAGGFPPPRAQSASGSTSACVRREEAHRCAKRDDTEGEAQDGPSEGEASLRSIKRVLGGLWPEDPVPGLDATPTKEGGTARSLALASRLSQAPLGPAPQPAMRDGRRGPCPPFDPHVVPGPTPGTTSALELATAYLTWVRDMVVFHSNLELGPDEPLQAMVAVPAHASTGQRYLTVEAFRQAGFEVLGLISEPTAAAIEFAERNRASIGKRSPKRYVVVYDLGGGTFDSSAVSLAGRRFDLLKTEGISRLGGDDFDEILLAMACEQAGLELSGLSGGVIAHLLELCREAKETLGSNSRRVMVDLGQVLAGGETVVLETQAFFDRCQPLIDRSLELLDRVFQSLAPFGIDTENPRELGAIYLVGGATAFPPVARSLKRVYGRKIQLAPQAHAATAVGLAIAADPEAEVFIREATTRHFGVWREGQAGRAKRFDPILLKDTSDLGTGLTVRRSYRPTHTIGHLRFLECTELDAEGQPGGDLTPWANVFFPYDPALAATADLAAVPIDRLPHLGSELIQETYEYGAKGTLTIRIENLTRGYCREFSAPWG